MSPSCDCWSLQIGQVVRHHQLEWQGHECEEAWRQQVHLGFHYQAIDHRITTPGFAQSFCIFISRRIENSNDEAELPFEWRAKYSQQKAEVKLFKQQLMRTQET